MLEVLLSGYSGPARLESLHHLPADDLGSYQADGLLLC